MSSARQARRDSWRALAWVAGGAVVLGVAGSVVWGPLGQAPGLVVLAAFGLVAAAYAAVGVLALVGRRRASQARGQAVVVDATDRIYRESQVRRMRERGAA